MTSNLNPSDVLRSEIFWLNIQKIQKVNLGPNEYQFFITGHFLDLLFANFMDVRRNKLGECKVNVAATGLLFIFSKEKELNPLDLYAYSFIP
jgi:hypothetical protein